MRHGAIDQTIERARTFGWPNSRPQHSVPRRVKWLQTFVLGPSQLDAFFFAGAQLTPRRAEEQVPTMKKVSEDLARLGQALERQNVEWRSVCDALVAQGSETRVPKQVLTAFERIFDEAPPVPAGKPPSPFALRA